MSSKLSRKGFLKASALGTAGAVFASKSVFASANSMSNAAPSDTINIALIGCGAQGPGVARNHAGLGDVNVIAGCDVYGRKRDAFEQSMKEAGQKNFKSYENFEEVMENKDIDAVIIATPDHWHSLIGVAACQAGKDIYVEKPMSFTVFEGDQLVKATRKYSRIMQTGSMQRSMPTFEQMIKIAHSGALGKIKMIYAPVGDGPHEIDYKAEPVPEDLNWDKWLGPLSTEYYYNDELCPAGGGWGGWRWHKGLGGGYTTDWGAHMFDIAQWAIGKDGSAPITVMAPETSPYKALTYVYDNGIEMVQHCDPWDGDRGNSVKIYGENGWIFASRSNYYCSNPEWSREGQDDTVMPKADPYEGMTYEEEGIARAKEAAEREARMAEGGGFRAGVGRDGYEVNTKHYRSFVDGIKSRIDPNTPVEYGNSSATVCNIGNIAYDLKRTLTWNPIAKKFMNDEEANNHRIMKYEMRAPYQIDTI